MAKIKRANISYTKISWSTVYMYMYTVHKLCSAVTISSHHKYYGLKVTILSHQVWHVHVHGEDANLLNVELCEVYYVHSHALGLSMHEYRKGLGTKTMITLPWRECWGPQLWWWRGPSWLWFSHALLVHSTHAAAAEKMWAQCTHGCYKWSEDTLQVKYDGQRPSSVYSSLLNQRADDLICY